jgi:hypothetical protein
MSNQVYIHVGLPKTGTSYVQRALWRNQDRLAAQGITIPGKQQPFQRHAVSDLLGRRLQGADQPHMAGSWQRLVDAVQTSSAQTAILSEEFLVHARPAQVARIVRDLRPAEVHIIVTVRDLGRALGSMWQHDVSQGATWPWSEFVAAVRDPKHGPPTAGVGFWLRYDLRRVLAVWETTIPAQRISVVVVPPSSAPASRLLDLFAEATGVSASALTPPERPANTSVGVAETEVLRRLNASLRRRLNEQQQVRVFTQTLKPALRASGNSSQLRIPDECDAWLAASSNDLIRFLETSDYKVVGDVEDLRSDGHALDAVDPAELGDKALLEAAMSALTGLTESYAGESWKARRRTDADETNAKTRLASSSRAFGFKARMRAFELADRNALLATAARHYLRRRARPL